MENKLCIKCDYYLPINKFYKAGKYYQSSCISCYNNLRIDHRKSLSYIRPLKERGFDALSEEQKENLLELICYKYNYKDISHYTGINYRTLIHWKKMQWIPKYNEYFLNIL